MYTQEEIRAANSTSRTNGASAKSKDGNIRAIVPRYIAEHINKDTAILDFGAGKDAIHTKWLKEQGFNCTAYDFGNNCKTSLHNPQALNNLYPVVFASNVINVQISMSMLVKTLHQIYNSLAINGIFIANYPSSPRKMNLSTSDMAAIIENEFNCHAEIIGGTKQSPIWKFVKTAKDFTRSEE